LSLKCAQQEQNGSADACAWLAVAADYGLLNNPNHGAADFYLAMAVNQGYSNPRYTSQGYGEGERQQPATHPDMLGLDWVRTSDPDAAFLLALLVPALSETWLHVAARDTTEAELGRDKLRVFGCVELGSRLRKHTLQVCPRLGDPRLGQCAVSDLALEIEPWGTRFLDKADSCRLLEELGAIFWSKQRCQARGPGRAHCALLLLQVSDAVKSE
jgi:hypothetical protein